MKTKNKYRERRIEAACEIITSIDHWLVNWTKGKIDRRVGALIQRFAMRELAFMDYVYDKWIPMDDLRKMANDQLERYGEIRIPKPITVPDYSKLVAEADTHFAVVIAKKQKELSDSISNYAFNIPSKNLSIQNAPKKLSRRDELEAMSYEEVTKIYDKIEKEKRDARRKGNRERRRKNRISIILEHEGEK